MCYIADTGNARILRLSKDFEYISQFGSKGKGDGEFATARGAEEVDSAGRIYVGDRNNNRVQVFSREGEVRGELDGVLGNPFGVLIVQGPVADGGGRRDCHKVLCLLEPEGEVPGAFGGKEVMQLPHFMDYTKDGLLYVAEVDGKQGWILSRDEGLSDASKVPLISDRLSAAAWAQDPTQKQNEMGKAHAPLLQPNVPPSAVAARMTADLASAVASAG
jgi:hypothetical protein